VCTEHGHAIYEVLDFGCAADGACGLNTERLVQLEKAAAKVAGSLPGVDAGNTCPISYDLFMTGQYLRSKIFTIFTQRPLNLQGQDCRERW